MIDGLGHDGGSEHECSVCSCEYTDEEGGVEGFFGIIPVAFCPNCFTCMCDMVEQYMGYGEEEDE
tara:strand:- start:653 stop:847 length:195 start_codon:yes stop_codon:yes gene_type:complete